MGTVGIDIGGRVHVAARCREGQAHADRSVLKISQSRAGFTALDAWLDAGPEPVELVVMESSGHYWMPLAAHLKRRGVPVAVVNPLAARYFASSGLEPPVPNRARGCCNVITAKRTGRLSIGGLASELGRRRDFDLLRTSPGVAVSTTISSRRLPRLYHVWRLTAQRWHSSCDRTC